MIFESMTERIDRLENRANDLELLLIVLLNRMAASASGPPGAIDPGVEIPRKELVENHGLALEIWRTDNNPDFKVTVKVVPRESKS